MPDRRRARARPRATPAKILVVWDNKIIRRLVRLTLQAEAYEVIEAGDAATALALAPRERPDLILQDLRLPDLDGFDLLRRLRALPEIVDVPVIAISGFVSRLAEARASAIGFSDFLVKPLQPTELLRAIQAHLPSRVTAPGAGANQRVLFVDDDPVQRKLGRLQLEAYGFRVQTADDGVEALAMARTHPFDVVVSDVLMPRLDGFGLCLAIRQDLHLAHLPVVLCSNTYLDADDEALGQRLGASAFVARTADMNTVADAALAALHQGSVPTPVGLPTELHDRHVYRIISQLEHQAALNAGLARRCASQSAALTILSTISDTLAKSLDRDFGIDEVLGSCLEAGGFLVGTLYLLDGAGRLRVNAQSGYYRRASRDDVERLFGHEPLFRAALERGTPLAIPSPAVAEATAREFLSRTGVSAALILPIVFRDERLGALVVAADPTDLSHEESLDFARTIGHQIGQVIALRRAFTRMATAEQEYRGIFEHAVEGIFRATPDGRYLLVNPAMAGIFGYATPDDMVTSLTDMWTELHADPGERDALLHLLSSRGSVSRFEGQARRRDGTVIWISQSVRAVHDVDGRVVYYEGLLEDITERKRTEAALRQSEKLAAMSSLVAGLAHELNNPLSVILAHSTLLAARGATNAQARASKIVQAAERCARLVRNFLAMARQHPPERQRVVLDQVVRDTVELLAYPLRVDSVTVDLELAPDMPPLWADPHQLQQVLLNLLTNAHHAVRTVSPPRTIAITTGMAGRAQVQVRVVDNGPGIPPEARKRVFEPFFTTKSVGQGTGLGLSLCKGIVESHGGTLSFESPPEGGAAFIVALPVTTPPATASPAVAPAERVAALRVLVVDDEPEVAGVLVDMLTLDGHRVEVAANGLVALERVRDGNYDLVISDLRMPELDGAGLYRRLQEAGHPITRRFVFVTGDVLGPETHEFLGQAGILALAKPFVLSEVRQVLRQVVAIETRPT